MSNIATSRILYEPERTSPPSLHRPWVWPLPRLDGIAPCILFPADDRLDGVDVGYPGRSSSPDFVPVFAACDGVVAYAGTAGGSSMICLDHPGGWSTQYAELARLLPMPTDRFRRRRKLRVRAGDVLGHARPDRLRVRFGLEKLTDGERSIVNSAEAMHAWAQLPWFSEPATSAAQQCAA